MQPRLYRRVAGLHLLPDAGPRQQAGEEFTRSRRVIPVVAPSRESADQQRLAAAGRMLHGGDVAVGVLARRLASRQPVLLQEVLAADLLVPHGQGKFPQQVGSELDISLAGAE